MRVAMFEKFPLVIEFAEGGFIFQAGQYALDGCFLRAKGKTLEIHREHTATSRELQIQTLGIEALLSVSWGHTQPCYGGCVPVTKE